MGKALVALMIVGTVGLGIGVVLAQQASTIREAKRRETHVLLSAYREKVVRARLRPDLRDDLGIRMGFLSEKGEKWGSTLFAISPSNEKGLRPRDAWDHPIYYCCPGPIHPNGWDLISCGPNSIYDGGGGDDVAVGEDLPGGIVAPENRKNAKCRELLSDFATLVVFFGIPRTSSHPGTDPTGLDAIYDAFRPYMFSKKDFRKSLAPSQQRAVATLEVDPPAVDAWGNSIYYRCPGPIHKNGFDLISCGPNGVYEEGGGDDIVVGEDLPGGIAAISSESGTQASQGK